MIVLTTSDKAAMKRDGEYIIEPKEIGKNLKNKRSIKEITLHPGESIDQSQKDQINKLCKKLISFVPHTKDTDEVVEKIEDWARENNKNLKKVNKSLKAEISEDQNIDNLIEALEPAFNGEKLDKEELAGEKVLEEADRYNDGRELFTESEKWLKLSKQKKALETYYPTEEITREVQEAIQSKQVPDHKQVEELVKRAENFRQDRIIDIAENLLFEEKSRSSVKELLEEVNNTFQEKRTEIEDNISEVESKVPNTELQELSDIIGRKITENDVANHKVRGESEKYYKAVKILDEGLWEDLENKYQELSEENPDASITREFEEIVEKGQRLPTLEEAEKLLEDAEEPEKSDDNDEDENQYFEEVWEKVQNLEEDSIVVIKDSVDTE